MTSLPYNTHYYRFLIGDDVPGGGSGVGGAGESGKCPWVYISMDGHVQSCKLFVYSVSHKLYIIIIVLLFTFSCVR